MTDINIELFKRYQPKKKLEIIEALTEKELLAVKESTVIRIVKEVGKAHYRSKRDKLLSINSERRRGNCWNSTFEGVDFYKGELYVELYLQYENTDTNMSEEWRRFIRKGNYEGQCRRDDKMGNLRTYYFTYTEIQKVRCIKSILQEYVYCKYPDKLN